MTTITADLATLYKVGRGSVRFVDVPELGYALVEGSGAPAGQEFAAAMQALYTVSYGAHFAVKKDRGAAPKVMPLEAQWWVDDPHQQDIVTAVALGQAAMAETDFDLWRWRAMIVQPDPIDAAVMVSSIEEARAMKELTALERLRYERWEEGSCAQVLHVGPYADEGPTIVRLHEAIAAAGYQPWGRHHEIYLGDPRRSAPEKLRTILRHPVEQSLGQHPARGQATSSPSR
jgi:hypothetical protein